MLKIYKKHMQNNDKIIVLLGSKKTVLNNDILELNCGDLYKFTRKSCIRNTIHI